MKQLSRSAKRKQQKQRAQAEPRPGPQKPGKSALPRWAWVALGLLLAGGGTWAVFEFVIWNKVPPALVGKWEVQGGPLAGGTFEFFRSGTVLMRYRTQETTVTLNGRAAVQGQALLITTQSPETRLAKTQRSIIRELTANSLRVELEKGDVLAMVRRQ
jgi:hypothetical protein